MLDRTESEYYIQSVDRSNNTELNGYCGKEITMMTRNNKNEIKLNCTLKKLKKYPSQNKIFDRYLYEILNLQKNEAEIVFFITPSLTKRNSFVFKVISP